MSFKESSLLGQINGEVADRERKASPRNEIVGRISGKLGKFIMERGGWNMDTGTPSDFGSFYIDVGSKDNPNLISVEVGFDEKTQGRSNFPESMYIRAQEEDPHHPFPRPERILTIFGFIPPESSRTTTHFQIVDRNGNEIRSIYELRKVERLTFIIIKNGSIHIGKVSLNDSN